MIRLPHARLTIPPGTFKYAAALIDRSGCVDLVEQWLKQDSGLDQADILDAARASTTHRSLTGAYSTRALLIGLYLLVVTRQPISWTALLQLFWFQLDRTQVQTLGLGKTIDAARQERLLPLASDAEAHWPADASASYRSEYGRLVHSLNQMFSTIRWSEHRRSAKQTNAALKERVRSLSAEERDALKNKKERHDRLINTLIAASVDRRLMAHHRGDIVFDEVVIDVTKGQGNTGTRDDKRHAGNPDAGMWKKGEKEIWRWAHGATFVMVTHRPGEKRIPTVVVGMSLGKPTGGRVDETMIAVRQAQQTGLLDKRSPRGKNRYAIADMGFTNKDGLNEALVADGYYLVQDYQDNVSRRHELHKNPWDPRSPQGPTLFNGILICPGFDPLTRQAFDMLPKNASTNEQIRHQQREAQLLAGRMHPNIRPEVAKQQGRGRPKAGAVPQVGMRVQVSCPAAAGEVRCPIFESSMALSPATTPTVVSPPNPANLPYVCGHTYTPVLMDAKRFKQYGVHLYGSVAHQRLYKNGRALNEQWHSQLRADHTGGIDGSVFKTLGVERIGLITALAVAETNQAMQRSFRHKHQSSTAQTRAA